MTTSRRALSTGHAYSAIGPYSQAIVAGNLLFCSGQVPLDLDTGEVVGQGDIAAQARRTLDNLAKVLEVAGTSFDRIVKTTIFLADMGDYAAVNAVYAERFGAEPPARSAVEVARLPKDVGIEIEAIALLD